MESGKVEITLAGGEKLQADREIASMLPLVKSTLEDGRKVVLTKVSGKTMRRMLEFCKHVKENPPGPKIEKPLKTGRLQDLIGKWYADFVDINQEELFDLINAAEFIGIKSLLDLGCAKVASLMRGIESSACLLGKKAHEIVAMFHIERDFTAEEEMRISKEYKWTEELL